MLSVFLSIFCMAYEPAKVWADVRVRRVQVQNDQIVQVKTAIGIATIIQVPDRPNSIVVGDQNAFKVEYLDQAITIKPIQGGAKSNLYIYTDFRRFNVQLVSGIQAASDYVVYLENPKEKIKTPQLAWKSAKNFLKNDSLTFETLRTAKTRDGILLVEFKITSQKSETFKADWLWLSQGGVVRPIHNLAFSGQELGPRKSISGVVQILRADVSLSESLRIELRRKKTTYLTLPKAVSW
ncbi:MAG: TrbG/VirB9 family P-type conjugative transfer protein [Bdellovibrionales bacterium]|nr:TrbG/VirB9 family P-type conjugative transfer protein [Bdellovibrionales bacterium]